MAAFIGAVLILLGAVGLLAGAVAQILARKQFGWEGVEGTVRASEVHFNWEFYEPWIEYTYSYRGRTFQGKKVRSHSILVNWRGPSQHVVQKYPPGSCVTVFVNPKNPWDAVLERGGDPRFFPLLLGSSVTLVVIGMMCLSAR